MYRPQIIAQHIQPVEPAHADRPAFAPPVVVQVGQQHVVTQVVIIEVADHQHPHGAVGISMDDDGRAVGRFGSRGVERMEPHALRIDDHRIAQRSGPFEAVRPRTQERILGVHIFIGRRIFRPHRLFRAQREAEHVETPADNSSYQQQHKKGYDP